MNLTRYVSILLIVFLAVFGWSAIEPHDYFTWFLEVFPALVGLVLLAATYRTFPLTRLLYALIFIHAVILVVGGHYTYARVPVGFWIQEVLGLARNPYDRFGHFAQGFIPAILAREILLRKTPLEDGKWLIAIVTAFCLAFSALYELIEWLAAIGGEEAAADFLGAQGDVWDTQWDMFICLIGALVAQVTLRPWHRRQLATDGYNRP